MNRIILFFSLLFFLQVNAQSSNCKCCTEKHAEFDFWIGSWIVTNPNGELAGKNEIKKIQDNCILQENWTSAKGKYTGTSSNFYNAQTKQWEQIWLDNQGGSLHLKGNRIGNKMILQTTESINKDGNPYIHRITWTTNDDGTVRQLWETITNDSEAVSYTHLTLPTKESRCRSRWSPYH